LGSEEGGSEAGEDSSLMIREEKVWRGGVPGKKEERHVCGFIC
jgi:hypothetical protein